MIRLIIADDHAAVRNAWSFVLGRHSHIEIVATASSGNEAVEASLQLTPDIILMDINMEPMNGFEATEHLMSKLPSVKIIGISVNAEPSYAQKMLQLGAKGFITKTSASEEMVNGINEVMAGNIYICEEVKRKMQN